MRRSRCRRNSAQSTASWSTRRCACAGPSRARSNSMNAMFGMPTRTEIDGAHRKIAELERALRRLRNAVARAVAAGARNRQDSAATAAADKSRQRRKPPSPNKPAAEAAHAQQRQDAKAKRDERPVQFHADGLAHEAMQMQQKLAAGVETLRNVDDVDYGATDEAGSLARRQSRAVPLHRRKHADRQSAAADQLRAGQPPVHGRPAGRPFHRQRLAGARRGRLRHRLGLSGSFRPFPDARGLHRTLPRRRGRPSAPRTRPGRDQPARHLPGRRVLAVLRRRCIRKRSAT